MRAPIDDNQQPYASQIAAAPLQPPHVSQQQSYAHSNPVSAALPFPRDLALHDTGRSGVALESAMPRQSMQSSQLAHQPALVGAEHSAQFWEQSQFTHLNQQQDLHVRPQPPQHLHGTQFSSLPNGPAAAPTAAFEDTRADVAHAEKELELLNIAIEEAKARQLSLKEEIATVNADIAAATKALNVKRDRATDLQQVCASLQQGHAGLKTVLAEAAQLPQESEGLEKMRARFFLVQSNGHKTRQAIQVVDAIAARCSLCGHSPCNPLQMLQADLDIMREQVLLLQPCRY